MIINLDKFTVERHIGADCIIYNESTYTSGAYQFKYFIRWFKIALESNSKKQLGRTFLLYLFYIDVDITKRGYKSIDGYSSPLPPFTSSIYGNFFNAFFKINSTSISIKRIRMNYEARDVNEIKLKNRESSIELNQIEKVFKQYNKQCKKFIEEYEKSKKHNS